MMSKLEKLIQELCPDGVEYKKLGEIATILRGGNLQKKDFRTEGVPCIHYGQIYTRYGLFADKAFSFISENCSKKQKMAYTSDIIMAVTSENIEDVCKCVAWLGEEAIAVSGHTAIIHHNQNAKYLVYYFHTKMFVTQKRKLVHGTKVMEVTPDTLNTVTLPVPPLPVQNEIVRILDNFMELTAELMAELTARKKQYEYYRDILLEKYIGAKKVKLSTICAIYDGTHQTPQYTDDGIPFVSVENIDDLYGTTKYISKEAYSKFKIKPQIGDVFMTRITAGIIGKCAVVDRNDDLAYYVSLALLRPNKAILDSRYLKYYLESGLGKRELHKRILWNATPTKINKEDIGKLDISIPPLDIQKDLVRILDNFDALCSNPISALPTEIEARQKQYEYYRDKLLTFKELNA